MNKERSIASKIDAYQRLACQAEKAGDKEHASLYRDMAAAIQYSSFGSVTPPEWNEEDDEKES